MGVKQVVHALKHIHIMCFSKSLQRIYVSDGYRPVGTRAGSDTLVDLAIGTRVLARKFSQSGKKIDFASLG